MNTNMIDISIEKSLRASVPNLVLGVVHATVDVSKHDDGLWREIEQRATALASTLTPDTLYEISGIKELRDGYRSIGKDPTRYRGSAEALVRRIIQGKGLYQINTVVDINNLVSLESMHSIGSYDLGKLKQPIVFRIGKDGECYKGIGKEIINITELPIFADAAGPFGSPTSDSERAMITAATHNLMMVVISFTGSARVQEHLDRIKDLLCRYANAPRDMVETFVVY